MKIHTYPKFIKSFLGCMVLIIVFPGLSRAQSLSGWDGAVLRDRQPVAMLLMDATTDGDLDAAGVLNMPLTGRWRFAGSVMVTNRSPGWLGATHSRPDLPVPYGTGRFLSGEIIYDSEHLKLRLGRLFPDYHPWRQVTPLARETISGDGVDVGYVKDWLNFQTRVQFLKNEVAGGETVDRIFNYHRMGLAWGNWEMGMGEFLIYTGHDRGIDWVWSNPLVPYMVHNYDYYSQKVTEWGGDRDNTILYTDLTWQSDAGGVRVTSRLYVDEFQVDGKDREVRTDEWLWHHELRLPFSEKRTGRWQPAELGVTLALASAGFGYHEGLFTDMFVGDYALLPHASGRTQHVNVAAVWLGERGHVIGDLFWSRYADIGGLNPTQLHEREYVDVLESEALPGFRLRGEYTLKKPWLGIRGDLRWEGAEREILVGIVVGVSG